MPKKFTFWRNAIVCETHEVVAETEEEARDKLMQFCGTPVHEEWIDWATDQFEIEEVEELDPLYRMIKDYQ